MIKVTENKILVLLWLFWKYWCYCLCLRELHNYVLQAQREKEAALETLADREITIAKFRELVQQMQEQSRELRQRLEREYTKPVSALPEILDFKACVFVFCRKKMWTVPGGGHFSCRHLVCHSLWASPEIVRENEKVWANWNGSRQSAAVSYMWESV